MSQERRFGILGREIWSFRKGDLEISFKALSKHFPSNTKTFYTELEVEWKLNNVKYILILAPQLQETLHISPWDPSISPWDPPISPWDPVLSLKS